MQIEEILQQFKALGSETLKRQNANRGVQSEQFGVKLGDLRKIAAKIKKDHELSMQLWSTGIFEARLLAILVMDIAKLDKDAIDQLVRSERSTQIADWLNSYIVKEHPDREALRTQWLASEYAMALRAGWSLTAGRVARDPQGLDIAAILDRLESEMPDAAPEAKWTMNTTLAQIGIYHPKFRERALAIGEELGIYRDYPVSKGCTSPFAPIWINELVRRNESAAAERQ